MESEEYHSAEESFSMPSSSTKEFRNYSEVNAQAFSAIETNENYSQFHYDNSDSVAGSDKMIQQYNNQPKQRYVNQPEQHYTDEPEGATGGDSEPNVTRSVINKLSPETSLEFNKDGSVERGRHGSSLSRNTYTFTCVLPSVSSIRVAVLSKWDNIMGPRAVHVWKQHITENEDLGKTSNSVHYIVGHTLVAEELNKLSTEASRVMVAWFHVPQESMLYAAATFQVMEDGVRTPHCLSVAFEKEHMEKIVQWKQLIMDWLTGTATKIRIFLLKDREMKCIEAIVKTEMERLDDLLESLLHFQVTRRSLDQCVGLLADKQLAERAITSHLQTGSCSMVIASHQQLANEMINLLSYMVPKDKLCQSRYVVTKLSDQFQPGLTLQGIVLSQGVSFKEKNLLSSPFPLTVIDLRLGSVKQGLPYLLHQRARNNYQMQLLKSVVNVNTEPPSSSSGCCLRPVLEGSPIVRAFLKDVLKLPTAEWPAFFMLFYRQLQYKAFSLLSFVQDKLEKYRTERGSAWKRGLEKSAKKFLGMEQQDFMVIISIADHFQPGIIQLFTPSLSQSVG